MLYVENNTVAITQNDDAVLEITVEDDDGIEYALGETETLTLTVRLIPDETSDVLLSITGAPGSNRIPIRGADTIDIPPGRYSMDVQLNRSDGTRFTVIPDDMEPDERHKIKNWRNFVVMPEVTIP